ncbi:metallophosphoesterase [Actinoplanes derwentensis]|uniref:Calcineurin-like phosphoesterase n=1 Tax=Actinoplanes derwentensis TaxID=113562 RepID=A0A1H2DB77_9ACTN|nr:metallophosphoesterase [Actinoplanes derwentensis]GID88538.1 serine/threonine protein phosphatase [Actinoplanes derwentensis]SDT80010.1 Calcineurin-like phosphoesterase [Actinoplanes derwentensis]
MPPLFAVSDIHGHRDEFRAVLRDTGLTDAAGDWSGADARLWLLGDYFDRGPDGLGVIDDIRRLTGQAAAAGGEVGALLGNHEVQLLGAHRFGAAPIPGWEARADGWYGAWLQYGGRDSDLRGLTPEHLAWLSSLPALALVGDHLLMHCDSTRYLEFAGDLDEVNTIVAEQITGTDSGVWLYFVSRMSGRGELSAPAAVDALLGAYGGSVIVHGHSTLMSYFGYTPETIKEPHRYGDGRVLAIDGGVFEGGRLLVAELSTVR